MISFSVAQEPTCRTASSRLENLVASKVRELKRNELCQFRLYDHIHDIDGDLLMVFAVEGIHGSANAGRQFLVAFPSGSSWQRSVVEVGTVEFLEVVKLDVEGRTVVLTTRERKEGDAMCCLSGSGKLVFRFERGKLVTSKPVK
jgi:hypothetical protein